MITFKGYPRSYGPPGIRNAVLVISGDLCCNQWAKEIAAPFDNCYALTHKHGVGNYAPDRTLFLRLISGISIHPNVAGFVLVSSGNEDHTPEEIVSAAKKAGRKSHIVSAKKVTNTSALISLGKKYAGQLVKDATTITRVETGIEYLRIGLNCAGTDIVSGQTVHLILGKTMDKIVELGGTVVATEIPDLIGLDNKLYNRCQTEDVKNTMKTFLDRHEKRLGATGEKIDDIEMVAFNVDGGLKTLRQKAGVSILKTGTTKIREAFEYGQIPSQSGLVFMDGPAMTDFVITGFMSAGVHLMINTCGAGEGNKMPFTVGADEPTPILPVLKMTGSSKYFRQTVNRIDFDAGKPLNGKDDLEKASEKLFRRILDIASGKQTMTETPKDYFLNIPMQYFQA